MSEKIEKVTNRLIRLYANGSTKAEAKFRSSMLNFDWDKEEQSLKSRLNIYRILFSIIFVLILILFVMHIVNHTVSSSTISAVFAIFFSSIALLFEIKRISQKYEALKLLRKLLGK